MNNMAFALSLEPDNAKLIPKRSQIDAARDKGVPTVPSTLAVEMETNPFLRADDPALKQAIGLPDADPVDVFAEVRKRKDNF
jgi:hydroxyacylglutathione hydrolase